MREAQAEYFSARYGRAFKAARQALALAEEGGSDDREFKVLALLLAAGSLHRLQDGTRRDAQLKQLFALLQSPGGNRRADDGARLMAAEWALDDGQADRATALLSDLPPGTARRTQALRLRLRAARLDRKPAEALHMARLLGIPYPGRRGRSRTPWATVATARPILANGIWRPATGVRRLSARCMRRRWCRLSTVAGSVFGKGLRVGSC